MVGAEGWDPPHTGEQESERLMQPEELIGRGALTSGAWGTQGGDLRHGSATHAPSLCS